MHPVLVADDVEVDLPTDWIEYPNPGGPKEYRARSDGATGLLQVSVLPSDQFELASKQPDLGYVAAEIGKALGARGQNWGTPSGSKHGTCAMGRFGFATFQGGEYPAMFLWVTVSSDSALLWTWLGPSPVAEEVRDALQVVLLARQRGTR